MAHGLPTKYADFSEVYRFFFTSISAQESSGLELIGGDINCYKYFTDLFNSNKILNLISIYMINQEKTPCELRICARIMHGLNIFQRCIKAESKKEKDGVD